MDPPAGTRDQIIPNRRSRAIPSILSPASSGNRFVRARGAELKTRFRRIDADVKKGGGTGRDLGRAQGPVRGPVLRGTTTGGRAGTVELLCPGSSTPRQTSPPRSTPYAESRNQGLFNNPAQEGLYSSLPACGWTRHTSIIEPTMPLGASSIVMMKNSPMTRMARSVCSPRKSFRK